jgi:nicotinate-nucleotide adenylyltransferase
LILGWDAASQLRSWHRPDDVIALAPLIVVTRPGRDTPGEAELRSAGLDPSRIIVCDRPTPSVSGSEIRRAIAAGKRVTGMVPEAVERYLAVHHVYGA